MARQLDISYANGDFITLPKHLPGRINTDDFVFFFYNGIDPSQYEVVVESNDTADISYRRIGRLASQVKLPEVIFGAYASILVMPHSNPYLPTYYSRLNRGSTYIIRTPTGRTPPGTKIEMVRTGMLTAGAGDSNIL